MRSYSKGSHRLDLADVVILLSPWILAWAIIGTVAFGIWLALN